MKKTATLLITILFLSLFSGCKPPVTVKQNYEIYATLNQDMTLDCAMTYTFCNDYDNSLKEIKFSLYPNAFSERATVKPLFDSDYEDAYIGETNYGGMEIKSVKSSGKDLLFETSGINDGTLTVKFNAPLKLNETATIYMDFLVKLPKIKHRFGSGNNTVNLSGFYPIACVYENGGFYESVYYPAGDPFYSNTANYLVNLTVPSTYTLASSMKVEKTVWSGGETEYQMVRNGVKDIAFILSEKFNVLQKTVNGIDVKYYYYNDQNPQLSLDTAVKSLEYFSKKYVVYPYSEYVVCQGDFLYGGMEYPCLSLISDNLNEENNLYTVVHETAHQWFYGLVGVNQNEEGFFDEGLTELSTALFLSDCYSEKYQFNEMVTQTQNLYNSLKKALETSVGTVNTSMKRNLKTFKSNAEYVMLAYNRSMLMFSDALTAMGKDKFIAFLKDFTAKNSGKNVKFSDFVNGLSRKNKKAGKVIEGYLSQSNG